MEIIDSLQLVFLLGLLAAVAILLISLRAARRSAGKHDKDELSEKNQSRLASNRAVHRPRSALNRQLDKRLAGG